MENYLPSIPDSVDTSTGIPKEALGLRQGMRIALASYQDACSQAEQDPELRSINDATYVGKKIAERKAVAAASAERELQRLEKIVAGHESGLEADAAKLTLGKGPDEATKAAVIQSFTALDKQGRQAMLLAAESDLSVPSKAADARAYLTAILQANSFLNLLPTLVINGMSMRDRLEASLKASLNPSEFKRVNDSKLALQAAKESAQRIREIIGGNRDVRARMVRSE